MRLKLPGLRFQGLFPFWLRSFRKLKRMNILTDLETVKRVHDAFLIFLYAKNLPSYFIHYLLHSLARFIMHHISLGLMRNLIRSNRELSLNFE